MEFLVRLAGYKYQRNGFCSTWSESVERLFEEGLKLKLESEIRADFWRKERFWVENVDDIFSQELEFLESLYGVWAG